MPIHNGRLHSVTVEIQNKFNCITYNPYEQNI